jgi:hypothetical protein
MNVGDAMTLLQDPFPRSKICVFTKNMTRTNAKVYALVMLHLKSLSLASQNIRAKVSGVIGK